MDLQKNIPISARKDRSRLKSGKGGIRLKRDKPSSAVIRRMPRYYRRLNELHQSGVVRVSSGDLARSMGLTASQIRQDLSCFGGFGQQGYGYNVEKLRGEIGDILGMNLGNTAIILGVGNLGRALMKNFSFASHGFRLVAAFDTQASLIGTRINGVPVLDIAGLEAYLRTQPVSVGILTVPQSAANETANRLVLAGVPGIWNFTNRDLNIPDADVVVENVHFGDSLLTLSYLIAHEETSEPQASS